MASSLGSKKEGGSNSTVFEDLFPSMMDKLGRDGFMEELCKGFRLLMDQEKGVITFESLKTNSASVLGLDFYKKSKGISNDDDQDGDDIIREMLREGDLDGDGCLNQMEFCVLMFRLSPALMDASKHCLPTSFF